MQGLESKPFERDFVCIGASRTRKETVPTENTTHHFLPRPMIGGMLGIGKELPLIGTFFILPLESTSYMSGAVVPICHVKSMSNG